MTNTIILGCLLTSLTLAGSQTLLPNSNCQSDYYIREYHYHKSDDGDERDIATTPSEHIPQELQHEKEVSALQKELIEEKKKRQKDIHYMLRIVDRLLRRKEREEDDLERDDKVTRDDSDSRRYDANDTTNLRQEWETATKKLRRDKKRSRKGKGAFRDPQLRSDEGRPDDPSVTLTSGPRNEAERSYDDVIKVIRELQQEVKGLQARQVQIYRVYKKSNMAVRRSTTLFKQTMDKHHRLQMFHNSQVARLKWQLTNQTESCQVRMRLMENKLDCVMQTTGSGLSCQKVGLNDFDQRAKTKQIRDVSEQINQNNHKSLTYTEDGTFDVTKFEPETMSVLVDDPSDVKDVFLGKDDNAEAFEENPEDDLQGNLFDDSIGDQIEADDIDLELEKSDLDLSLAPGDLVSNYNQDDVITLAENEVERKDRRAVARKDPDLSEKDPDLSEKSLSIRGLWDILVKAGKHAVMWSEIRQSQRLPKDCSDIDLWSQRWSPEQTVYIGHDRVPLRVRCHEGWLLIQENKDNSTTKKIDASDSYETGIQSEDFFWIGNRYLSTMTSEGDYSLHVELETFDNRTVITEYSSFKVSPPDSSFRLEVSEIRRDEIGDIFGTNSFNPITEFEFIVPILPVTLPSGEYDKSSSTYREVTTLRGWWYPRRPLVPNMTTAQTHLPIKNSVNCYSHLNAEHPFYCGFNGEVIKVKSTKMMMRRNFA